MRHSRRGSPADERSELPAVELASASVPDVNVAGEARCPIGAASFTVPPEAGAGAPAAPRRTGGAAGSIPMRATALRSA